jgi:dihydrofolate synthase/folylpolyglutamate synthase
MDTELAYNLALDYLYSFVDYSLKHSSELAKAEFNLDRMFALMEKLGNPQAKYPIIHVAGTKGKGSTAAFCASALQAAGYKVGLYTSPHLEDYCERIQINGKAVSHEQLVQLVEQVKEAVSQVPKLTTFEITTAIAFLFFAGQIVDAAVIEVGLGGRLDATNIVTPRVSVITSLSYDHMAVLGDTLAKIAGEKAGIIKPGVPVVSAPQKSEAEDVLLRIATERNAPLTLLGKDMTFNRTYHSLDGQSLRIQTPNWSAVDTSISPDEERRRKRRSISFQIPLLGIHQVENAATAYTALKLSGLKMPDEAIARGFATVRWPARFEIARHVPPVIFDSAHNQDSFARLREALDENFPNLPIFLIFGASEDKNIPGMFKELKPRIKWLIITRADHPRALEVEKIQALAEQAGLRYETVTPVEAALARALELSAKDGSIVLSAGSMFVTAEVITAWKKYPHSNPSPIGRGA